MQTLDYAPPFQMGHPLAFEAATKVAGIMPAGLDRIFFTNSGSESVDTALKIALAYHRARGEGQRTRIIGRERGYHGVGFGGMAVGGIGPNRKMFSANLMPGTDHLPATLNIAEAGFSRAAAVGRPPPMTRAHPGAARPVQRRRGDRRAAGRLGRRAGAAGGLPERLREITSKHGILLIFDEVITAFGRLGAATAAERFQVTPDLITMAKAINNAAVPMGAVAVKREVHDAVVNAAAAGAIELPHGYTYSAHPLACAAAIAALDIYARENLFGRAAALAPAFEAAVHGVRGAHVKDIRNRAWSPASSWNRAPASPAHAVTRPSSSARSAACWCAIPATSSPSRRR